MRPSSKNLVMNGVVQSFTNQKSLDEAQSTSFANTWEAFNGEAITLGDLFIDETAFAILSGLGCSFGAFNCHFKDGHRGNGLVWVKDGSLWAVEMLDEVSLPLHKISVDGKEEIIESDEKASGILSALICVENGGGGGTSENAVTIDTSQTITGSKTFKSPIKSNEIDNENGNAMLRYKETEGKNVVGGSNYPLTLMGSGDRPHYSKDGSNFEGNPLALKSDVDTNWNLLMDNLGVGRWANQTIVGDWTTSSTTFSDNLAPNYTNISRMFGYATFNLNGDTYHFPSFPLVTYAEHTFRNVSGIKNIVLGSFPKIHSSNFMFAYNTDVESITLEEGAVFKPYQWHDMFRGCTNLVHVGKFDGSGVAKNWLGDLSFVNCYKLKQIEIQHIGYNLQISDSTAFEESDLVEIISNLDTVTTTQTLTMGATNLAKLTDEEKKVATDKGWTLA